MTKTINDVYIELLRRFRGSDQPQPAMAAREITALACNADKNQMAQWGYMYLDDSTVGQANLLCDRCLGGEPLAYILGEWDFYGLTFKVNPSVLIPRADTELLCEMAILAVKDKPEPRVLDLCCGSGCIGVVLAHEVESAKVVAADISDEALRLARENARNNGVQGRYVALKADVMEHPGSSFGQYDLLISNPPYISAEEMSTLDSSVKDYEPHEALYGGPDGLDFYRSICSKWAGLLPPGGIAMFECGYNQAEAVVSILTENGFCNIGVTEDTAGIRRVVYSRRK